MCLCACTCIHTYTHTLLTRASLVAQTVKNVPAMQETQSSIPGLGRSPGGGKGNPLQYSCLENSMYRGTWWAIVHWVAKSCATITFSFTNAHKYFYIHVLKKKKKTCGSASGFSSIPLIHLFILHCIVKWSRSVVSDSLRPHAL